ncbi:unnamed protein product [Heligmosomoides polygyrus]|uniref:HTH_48 domain-containing protein n=1 Tax=Heligmosomoides polygyrus TaxID=6339 RepID=A0A183GGV3_HELPZ|nr:unnamed protein product [Heligmosomoides polygyrus]
MSSEREEKLDLIFDQFKLGSNQAMAAVNILTVIGKSNPDRTTCRRWCQKFRSGQKSKKDKPRPGDQQP